jgi:hypothetical protein
MRPINTICLCGSTRYMADFQAANHELTKLGFSVITISMALPKESGEMKPEDQPLKELLDLVHFNKILRADAVLIVGVDTEVIPPKGYCGFSTAREALWADMQGKPIVCQVSFTGWKGTDWEAVGSAFPDATNGNICNIAREVLRAGTGMAFDLRFFG